MERKIYSRAKRDANDRRPDIRRLSTATLLLVVHDTELVSDMKFYTDTAVHRGPRCTGVSPLDALELGPNAYAEQASLPLNFGQLISSKFDKQAADARVYSALVRIIQQAETDANHLLVYIDGCVATFQNVAHDDCTGGSEGPGSTSKSPPHAGDMSKDELLQLLEQLGITPDELEQAMATEAGLEGSCSR